MESKHNVKKTPANFSFLLSGRAVPLELNVPGNRFPFPVSIRSDFTRALVLFYEHEGVYWYSITIESSCTFNSVPFLSVQNAITEFRSFLRGHDFRFVDREFSECRLDALRRQPSPKSSEV